MKKPNGIAVLLFIGLFGHISGYAIGGDSENNTRNEHLQQLQNEVFSKVFKAPESVYLLAHQLLNEAHEAHSLIYESRAHYYLTTIWINRDGQDSATYHSRQSLSKAIQSGDPLEVSDGYNMLGNMYEAVGKLDSALFAYGQSLSVAEIAENHKNITRALLNMGMIHKTKGEYVESIANLRDAESKCRLWEMGGYLPNLYLTLGDVYLVLKENDLALENIHKALRSAIWQSKPMIQTRAMLLLGQYHVRIGEMQEAACWFEEAKVIAHSVHNPVLESRALAGLAEVQLGLHQIEKAQKAALSAVKLLDQSHDTINRSHAYYSLGLVYLQSGQFGKANDACKRAFHYASKTENTPALIDICDCLWRSSEKSGDNKSALLHYQNYIHLRDSLQGAEASLAFARLEAKIEYNKKHTADSIFQANADLQREAQHQAELTIEKERSQWSFWLTVCVGIIAFAAIGGVFYIRRQNRKLSGKNALIQNQNDAINNALEEKEVLLREVHHRVKNNLQVMISLLDMQAQEVPDPKAKEALYASKGRVQAMTLIHQKLYQQENLAGLDFATYLRQLVEEVQRLFSSGDKIMIDVQLCETSFGIDAAVPLGLILNELVTNAFKYAFKRGEGGKLLVSLEKLAADEYELQVEDSGRGLSPEFNLQTVGTLGLQLVEGLARQLRGSLKIGQSKLGGASFTIKFKAEPV